MDWIELRIAVWLSFVVIPIFSSSLALAKSAELSEIEFYCSEFASFATHSPQWVKCVSSETSALKKIKNIMNQKPLEERQNLMSLCSGFTTGLRGLGSQEYVSNPPLLACMTAKNPTRLFNNCVRWITGKAPAGNVIHWGREQADTIAECFSQSISK
jgi:hypothetical protein